MTEHDRGHLDQDQTPRKARSSPDDWNHRGDGADRNGPRLHETPAVMPGRETLGTSGEPTSEACGHSDRIRTLSPCHRQQAATIQHGSEIALLRLMTPAIRKPGTAPR